MGCGWARESASARRCGLAALHRRRLDRARAAACAWARGCAWATGYASATACGLAADPEGTQQSLGAARPSAPSAWAMGLAPESAWATDLSAAAARAMDLSAA